MDTSIKIAIDALEEARLTLKDSIVANFEELEEAQSQLARMRMTSGSLGELGELEVEMNGINDYIQKVRIYINDIENLIEKMEKNQ
jgi:hypothetical protein